MTELELAERVEQYARANLGPSAPVGQELMREVVAALRRVSEPVGEDRVGIIDRFLADLAECADWDELAADGGITVGMVFQQQARWMRTLLARAAIAGDDRVARPREDKAEAHYVIRYLPPQQMGDGVIVHTFSSAAPNLNEYREANPETFARAGFYTLARATGQVLTVKARAALEDTRDAHG